MPAVTHWITTKRSAIAGATIAVGTGLAVMFAGGLASADTTATASADTTATSSAAATASAGAPSSTSPATSAGSGTAKAVGPGAGWIGQLSCDDLARVESAVQKWSAVIGADATTKGSTLWVQAELQKAKAAGNAKRTDRLQKVLDHRAAHPDRGTKLLARLDKAQAARCS